MGETKEAAVVSVQTAAAAVLAQPVAISTFAGKLHVEWDPAAAVTPLGQLPFFIEFLKVSGLFERYVQESAHCSTPAQTPRASGMFWEH
jgi:ACR3 family arsenite efflux pump ArsB